MCVNSTIVVNNVSQHVQLLLKQNNLIGLTSSQNTSLPRTFTLYRLQIQASRSHLNEAQNTSAAMLNGLNDGQQMRNLRLAYAFMVLWPSIQYLRLRPIPFGTLIAAAVLTAVYLLRVAPTVLAYVVGLNNVSLPAVNFLFRISSPVSLGNLSLHPHAVLGQRREIWRILTSAIAHIDIAHLSLNLASLVSMGPSIEENIGSFPFLCLLIALAAVSGSLYIIASALLGRNVSVAGISGVLFALMPLFGTESSYAFMGIHFPERFRYWAELFRTQLLTPEASLLGHISGLVTGYIFAAVRSALFSRRLRSQRVHVD